MKSYKSTPVKITVYYHFFIGLVFPALTLAVSDDVIVDIQTSYDLEEYRTRAENGDDGAQNILGLIYYRGDGVEKDYSKALKWFRVSSNQGNKEAQYHLGFMHYFLIAMSGNHDEQAFSLFKKSAEQGHVKAEFALGMMYYNGYASTGIANYVKAVRWLKLAASQGYALAQNQLGVMYETGKGVNKSLSDAKYWYQKSAEQRCSDGMINLSRIEKQLKIDVQVSNIEPISENVDNEENPQPLTSSLYGTNLCVKQCKAEYSRCKDNCGAISLLLLVAAMAGQGSEVPDCSACNRYRSTCISDC